MVKTGDLHTSKSWTQLNSELNDEFRKWGVPTHDIILPTSTEARNHGIVVVEFLWRGDWKKVECSKFAQGNNGAERNLSAIVGAIKAGRLADQRGIGSIFAQVAQLMALPDPDDPFTVLGITKGSSPSVIKDAYRQRVMKAHPDHGGTREEYDRVRKAAETLGVV